MKDQFIPCEQALELKELNFNEPCFACYLTDKFLNVEYTKKQFHFHGQVASAPLWQQAFDWFREVYGYEISIVKRTPTSYKFEISKLVTEGDDYFFNDFSFSTFQEARFACLNKLIELAKLEKTV